MSELTTASESRSLALRRRVVDTLGCAGRGHVGSALSLIEILQVLFDDVLRYDPADPDSPDRDRFLLSKGHGCLALYVLLADKGFIDSRELEKFCRFDGLLGGHPGPKIPGVEFATGSLGHGLSLAVGLAASAKMRQRRHRVFVVLGDGECNEGAVWEAALSAANHRLDNLVVIVDRNGLQSYGPTEEILALEPFARKWESFGFATREVDGHDVSALRSAFTEAPYGAGKPTAVVCRTVKGKGMAFAENNPAWHHKSRIDACEIAKMHTALGVGE